MATFATGVIQAGNGHCVLAAYDSVRSGWHHVLHMLQHGGYHLHGPRECLDS